MDPARKRVALTVIIMAWAVVGGGLLGGVGWWLFPRFAPQWAGRMADRITVLRRPIAARLYAYGSAEMMAGVDRNGTPDGLAHYQKAYHPLDEAYRLYVELSEAQPDDRFLQDRLLECAKFRYGAHQGVGMEVPP